MLHKSIDSSPKVLAIDCGSTSTKAAIFNQSGCIGDIAKFSNEGAIQKNGLISIKAFQRSFKKAVSKLLKQYSNIIAIGITGVGPTMCLCKKTTNGWKIPKFASSYAMSLKMVKEGIDKIQSSGIIAKRGIASGPQYTPEQLFQMKENGKSFDQVLITSLLTVIGSSLDNKMLQKLSIPSASYMGLINTETGEYIEEIFKVLNLPKNILPELTVGNSGQITTENPPAQIKIYEIGTDGPNLQHALGGNFITLGFGTTIAVRVNSRKPLKDLPWNILYKDKDRNKTYVSGKAANAGAGTWQLYFENRNNYDKFEAPLKALISSIRFPEILKNLPLELPFERGERDGSCGFSGLYDTISRKQSQKPKKDIELFYVLTEGVLFNMVQLIESVTSAVKTSQGLEISSFIVTGILTKNKVIHSFLHLMLAHLLKIKDVEFHTPVLDEAGLTSAAIEVFAKEELAESIPRLTASQVNKLAISKTALKMIKKRWECFQELYQQGCEKEASI